METIQIVLDKKLLQSADKAARRAKLNRSELVRNALREHLLKLEMRAKEDRDREGYTKLPQHGVESDHWASEAVWPEE